MRDVAIVGRGPVGVMAANLLGPVGLSTALLEREFEHYHLPCAVHLDHETLLLFQGDALRLFDQRSAQLGETYFAANA